MPIKTAYNADLNILFGSIEGVISLEEANEALTEIVSSKEFPADVDTIWDVRNMAIEQFDINFEKMLLAIRRDKDSERGAARIAIVTSSNMAFDIGRHYEDMSLGLSQNVRVFREPEAAQGWILSKKK